MAILVSAFSINKKDGAGWVSKRIDQRERFSRKITREDTFLNKSLWAMAGICILPYLHPIFSRYLPLFSGLKHQKDEVWLNFSQSFGLATVLKNSVLVCHDLQCHRPHRFSRWARWSERVLLGRASRVVVLSERDRQIVRRYYGVPLERIENLAPILMPDLQPFISKVRGPLRSIAFLGTLARKENKEGLGWFVEQVLPHCPDLEVLVIGEISPSHTLHHPQLRYLGFVDDLQGLIAHQDLMIAPLFSRAGIKIKVVETLLAKTPVLGTTAAYGGVRRPEGGWCSNEPADWIRILNDGGLYQFSGL